MSLLISLLSSFLLLIYPINVNPHEHVTYEIVGTVYCDDINQSCHSNTLNDALDGYWNIDIDNTNNLSLIDLNKFHKGKIVKIIYTGDIKDDESIEILGSEILK